ncbi:MAG TPA: hypothetical protein VM142_10695 [Acidimicrobiales bacterium]|nr:hypothetical protein [Acidimicrobiales bacterium]
MISSMVGVLVFLLLLLFAVQVLYGLYATSVVTAVTYDAAKSVAGSDGGDEAMAEAQRRATGQLGRYGDEVSFDWALSDDDAVRLTVRARRPSFFPRELVGDSFLGQIVRTVRVRVEKVR